MANKSIPKFKPNFIIKISFFNVHILDNESKKGYKKALIIRPLTETFDLIDYSLNAAMIKNNPDILANRILDFCEDKANNIEKKCREENIGFLNSFESENIILEIKIEDSKTISSVKSLFSFSYINSENKFRNMIRYNVFLNYFLAKFKINGNILKKVVA